MDSNQFIVPFLYWKGVIHIKSKEILYPQGKNDEYKTPDYAVYPIVKYIPIDKVIWCPFDKNDSEFVKIFRSFGYKVICSHIDYGQDFYEYEPAEEWDVIVSNPPFSKKRKIFERALSFNKPFALLMSNTWLNDSAPTTIFINAEKELQLLMFDKRIYFEQDNKVEKKVTFSSSYYCYDVLPNNLMTEILYRN